MNYLIYRFLIDKYVGSKNISDEVDRTEEIDLNNFIPVPKIIFRGVPGVRYEVLGGNNIPEDMLPGKNEETLFMPLGDIIIHTEPLDIYHVAIECSINAKPGKIIHVDVSKHLYGLFFCVFLGLTACRPYSSLYVASRKPRLSIAVSQRENIKGVDGKIRIKLPNKGLFNGRSNVVTYVDGRRVYKDGARLKIRETRWNDVDLSSFTKRLMEEDGDGQV